jgi:hypothetical protein
VREVRLPWPPVGLAPLAVVVLLFVASWLALCWLLGAVGGWQSLARHYAQGDRRFEGESRRLERASLGPLFDYGRCLTVGRGEPGIRLALLPPFVVGHPALIVPWADVEPAGRPKGAGPFRRVGLRFAKAPGVTLWVSADLAAWLAAGRRKALDTLAASPYNEQ